MRISVSSGWASIKSCNRIAVGLLATCLFFSQFAMQSLADTPPVVSNGSGASLITAGGATLNGSLSSTGDLPTEVWIYWGYSNGDDDKGLWGDSIPMGSLDVGSFQSAISGLDTNTTYFYRCYASNSAGEAWAPATAQFTTLASGGSFDIRIAAASDDAEERTNTFLTLASFDLELGENPDIVKGACQVGLRFLNVQIPPGVPITRAYIQFIARSNESAAADLWVYGEYTNNPATYATTARNITSRNKAVAAVNWTPDRWLSNEAGSPQRTPDLSAIVQEIADRSDWVSGNPMAFIIAGSGTRTARSYDSKPVDAATLHIEWGIPTPKVPEISNKSGASTVSSNSATLNGDLVSTGAAPAEVWVYWGSTDAGTDRNAWGNSIPMGELTSGVFSTNINGLTTGTTYFYRCYASNSVGDAWSSASAQFDTLTGAGDITSGLVLHWAFDEAGGSIALDSSGNNNTGTINNVAGDDWVTGRFGTAIHFDGVENVINSNLTAAVTGDLTISCWVNFTGNNIGNRRALDLAPATSAGLQMRSDSLGEIGWDNVGGPAIDSSSGIAMSDGLWHMVTYVRSGSSGNMYREYVDGQLVDTSTGTLVDYTRLFVGSGSQGNNWSGSIDDVRIFDRALSGSEVATIYAAPEVQSAPIIVASSAGNILSNSATLSGSLLSTGGLPTEVWVYWGTTDAGTDRDAWSSSAALGTMAVGTFTTNVTGLLSDTTYYFTCYASNSLGADWSVSASSFRTSLSTGVVHSAVSSSPGDAEELLLTGQMSLTSTDLDFLYADGSAQLVGVQFANVTVPAGAYVASAYIQFTARSNATGSGSVTIHGEATSNSAVFTAATSNISSRPLTAATANWALTNWTDSYSGSPTRTPDLSAVAQQIVNITGWESGNTMSFIFSGDAGTLAAWSYDNDPSSAPVLHIEWGQLTPTAPVISSWTGASSVTNTSATLNGDLTSTGSVPTEVWVYWGTTNAGTDRSSWSNSVSLGSLGTGTFSTSVTGLTENTTYFYSIYASNSIGQSWSTPVAQFLTTQSFVGEVDADGDGVADAWENLHFSGTNTTLTLDTDEDGMTDAGEYTAGTDPTNDLSYLSCQILPDPVNPTLAIVIHQQIPASGVGYTGKTRYYDLQTCDDMLVGNWQGVVNATNLEALTPMVFTYTNSADRANYRVKARLR